MDELLQGGRLTGGKMNIRPFTFFPKWLWVVIPLALLAFLIFLFIYTDPVKYLGMTVPPVEELTFERTVIDQNGIHLNVRANGSEPVSVAQVTVDDAYWRFVQSPGGPIRRLESVRIDIPYPWVEGELHEIKLITRTGITFSHTIEVAEPTPKWSLSSFLIFALIGIYVGILPVALGLMFYPYLRTLGNTGFRFLLSLTVGLLAFLFVDMISEGLEIASESADVFEPGVVLWLMVAFSFLAIFFLGRQKGKAPEGKQLAFYLALGIGLHNLGEGLAVGAAFTSGEVALGSFLVIGFTLHNITEGIGIAAPLVKKSAGIILFAVLALVAGTPAIAGILFGTFAYSPHWTVVLLAIGAGAILQVIVEVGDYLKRSSVKTGEHWLSMSSLCGFFLGLVFMYTTSLMVSI